MKSKRRTYLQARAVCRLGAGDTVAIDYYQLGCANVVVLIDNNVIGYVGNGQADKLLRWGAHTVNAEETKLVKIYLKGLQP